MSSVPSHAEFVPVCLACVCVCLSMELFSPETAQNFSPNHICTGKQNLSKSKHVVGAHQRSGVARRGRVVASTSLVCSDRCRTALVWQEGGISFQPPIPLFPSTRSIYIEGNVSIKTHQRQQHFTLSHCCRSEVFPHFWTDFFQKNF